MNVYKIADLIVHMDTFGRTLRQAEPYRIADAPADLTIHSTPEALRQKHPHLSLEDCEYLSTGGRFYRQLADFDGMMLHASSVVVDDRAYLFSAPCGTGKSTHVRLWLKLFGERAYILNDDKPALRIIDGTVYAYGTPWSGKDDCSRNARVELGGIAVVKRAAENSIRKLQPHEAIFALMDQTARSVSPEAMQKCMATIGKIVETGKIYELSCNMDITAAKLSYETMSGKRMNNEN
ncbi:MAG: hypothetical protein ACI3VU_01335 [Faecousia sp.]